jgi:hypothetical protein
VKKICSLVLAVASLFVTVKASAVSFNDVQFWIGSGTNRAALVVEWSTPESFGSSTVPAPIADKSLVWGYRFNDTATGTQMLEAILAADPRLYVVADETYGTFVEGIGFNLDGTGTAGLADSSNTNFLTTNFLTSVTVDIDAAYPLDTNDLYWGGYWGPNWETWTELNDAGGYENAPDRGKNAYWTPDDASNPYLGTHGEWEYAWEGLDALTLTNGSWIGFSVAAGEYESDTSAPYNTHKQAPKLPDVSISALVRNLTGSLRNGQWQAQFQSCSNWQYTLQQSADLISWTNMVSGVSGTGTNLMFLDTNAPADTAFYRVRAVLP